MESCASKAHNARLRANDDHPTKTVIAISGASIAIQGLDSSASGIDRVAATVEPCIGARERIGVRPRPPRGEKDGLTAEGGDNF
ncbi:hypothetical protein FWH09_01705 [Candidatus Saccharibacteria bacterium]|nr:hypothetical protein [Candidatus Saccharibacteria bacterium]